MTRAMMTARCVAAAAMGLALASSVRASDEPAEAAPPQDAPYILVEPKRAVRTGPDPERDAVRSDLERLARLREEAFSVAPFFSMHSRFRPTGVRGEFVADALAEWTRLREHDQSESLTHPKIRAVYQSVRGYILLNESYARPLIEGLKLAGLRVDPVKDPELALAEIICVTPDAIERDSLLLRWTKDYDDECRRAYWNAMRVIYHLGEAPEPVRAEDSPVRVRYRALDDRGGYIEAVNQSGLDLHNVTIVVQWISLKRSSERSYYFLPHWPKAAEGSGANQYPLRVPLEWWDIGAAATTAVVVEMISDERSIQSTQLDLDENIPAALDQVLERNESSVKKKVLPGKVVYEIKQIEDFLEKFPERQKKARDIKAQAQAIIDERVQKIDERLKKCERRVKDLKDGGVIGDERAEFDQLTATIEHLRARRQRIVLGME